MNEPDPTVQREADLDARIPHVFEAATGQKWDGAHAGTRSRVATDLVRILDVADEHDPARTRLQIATNDRRVLAQAIHDARGVLGFDNDGDTEPHTTDYQLMATNHIREAREVRAELDGSDV